MHFALPPRKTAYPPPYVRAAAARTSSERQRKLYQLGGYFVLGILTIYLIFHYAMRSHRNTDEEDERLPPGTPPVVIVTVFDDEQMSPDYIQKIMTNREDYAARHGYTNFFTDATLYAPLFHPSPRSWALVPALRHALTLYPSTPWLFSLSPHAVITNPSLSLQSHILNGPRLQSLMQKDIPIVPPDSVIHTFSHLTLPKTSLILTQDGENLAHGSFLLRNKPSDGWAQFFLDTWFDPLYRDYNFQRAEGHALEHIVQWHPTVLAKIVLVPQREMNSYNVMLSSEPKKEANPAKEAERKEGLWQEGDLLVRFIGCESSKQRNCEEEMKPYWEKWMGDVRRLDGKDGGGGKGAS